jgi:penicillin-binding protein 1A
LHEWAKQHFKVDGTPYNIYKDGLKIYTTINSRMQQYAEEAVREHMALDLQPAFFKHWEGYTNAPFVFPEETANKEVDKILKQAVRRSDRYRSLRNAGVSPDSISFSFHTPVRMRVFSWDGPVDTVMTPMDSIRYYKFYLQASLLSVDSHTGYVRAYVGGNDYRFFQYDHVTQAKRQVGSTFKPFLYTLAMQEGEYSPCFKVPNISYSVQLFDGTFWEPRNSSNDRIGEEVTLKWALANSNNWISAYLIKRFSPQAVIQLARKMGVTSPIDPVPAIALGTPDLSLYEMVGAMNTFANQGVYVKPIFITHIEDKNGNVIERFAPEKTEVLDEVSAYKMIELMKGVVESGTGIRLRFKYGLNNPIAGKTGTTQNQSDGWFMGITPDLTTGIWVGAEDRSVHFRTIKLGQGANMALPIWALYMQKVYNDPALGISQGDFKMPLADISIEFDCDKYEAQQARRNRNQQQQFEDDF